MTHKVLPTITYESMDSQAPRASVEVWLVSTRPQKKEAIEEQHVHTGIMKKKKVCIQTLGAATRNSGTLRSS